MPDQNKNLDQPMPQEGESLQQEYDDYAQELLNNAAQENPQFDDYTQNPYAGYPQESYYTQQYGYDPRYAQPQDGQEYGYDPRYAQPQDGQQYGYDPRQYGQQEPNYFGYQPYGQNPSDPQQNGGFYYDPSQYQQGPQQFDTQNYQYQPRESYRKNTEGSRKNAQTEQKHPYRRTRKDAGYNDDEYEAGDYGGEDEYYGDEDEEQGFFARIGSFFSKIPMRTLLTVGAGIVLLLLAIVLLVVVLPKNRETPPEIAASTATPALNVTPEPTEVPTPEPTATPHPVGTPLTFGMVGDVVAEIQERLYELGYMDIPTLEDGTQQFTTRYGTATKNAVRLFQSKNGLDVDGQCGELTYNLMMSDDCKAYFISRNDTDDFTGGKIAKMQTRLIELGYLNSAATGTCGEQTVQAIQKFQEKNGLEPDGKAGQQTLALMYGECIGADGNKHPAASSATVAAPAATPASAN